MARARIGDVALKAGVSKTAVSFAFNQPEHLNASTRARILAAAEELGYRPSPIARRLAARRTDQIGLVVPQSTHDIFANPFMPELLRGIGDACDAEGIAVVIVPPTGGSLARSVASALVDAGVAPRLSRDEIERRVVHSMWQPSYLPYRPMTKSDRGSEDPRPRTSPRGVALREPLRGFVTVNASQVLGHKDVSFGLVSLNGKPKKPK